MQKAIYEFIYAAFMQKLCPKTTQVFDSGEKGKKKWHNQN